MKLNLKGRAQKKINVIGVSADRPIRRLADSNTLVGWLGSRVVRVLDSGAEGPAGFKSQPRRCLVTVLGKLIQR